MKSLKKSFGFYGEDLAVEYLKSQGYEILERNFRCKIGEIDIIAKDNSFVVFIEVKSRYDNHYGNPCESITYSKKLKIYKTAQMYISFKKLNNSYFRFDVVEVTFNNLKRIQEINLIKDAFQL